MVEAVVMGEHFACFPPSSSTSSSSSSSSRSSSSSSSSARMEKYVLDDVVDIGVDAGDIGVEGVEPASWRRRLKIGAVTIFKGASGGG